jgi:hypothetical protein
VIGPILHTFVANILYNKMFRTLFGIS